MLTISSDSDPKYNSAMRDNSYLGTNTDIFALKEIFKCGNVLKPPFYVQDYPHIGTKLRNLFLKTIDNPAKLPFGNFYIQQEHLNQLMQKTNRNIF